MYFAHHDDLLPATHTEWYTHTYTHTQMIVTPWPYLFRKKITQSHPWKSRISSFGCEHSDGKRLVSEAKCVPFLLWQPVPHKCNDHWQLGPATNQQLAGVSTVYMSMS